MSEYEVIISLNRTCEMTSLSRTSINRLRASGQFPKPVPLGERRFGFVKAEVLAWIDERVMSRKNTTEYHTGLAVGYTE